MRRRSTKGLAFLGSLASTLLRLPGIVLTRHGSTLPRVIAYGGGESKKRDCRKKASATVSHSYVSKEVEKEGHCTIYPGEKVCLGPHQRRVVRLRRVRG